MTPQRACRLVLLAALLGSGALQGSEARAHALAPSLLALDEGATGEVEVLWRTPLQAAGGALLRPSFPFGCAPVALPEITRDETRQSERIRLRCSAGSLVGQRIAVEGLGASSTNVLLHVGLADGRRLQALLSGGTPAYEIPLRESRPAVLAGFFALGAEHLATGFDHLLFVAGLVLLLRGGRRLLAAITAFTAGHSATLALVSLGVLHVPSGLVEAGIALSLVVLASEILRGRGAATQGLLARRPWTMAFAFGLLHGLGFAGALHDAGLPADALPLALLGFNLGIEAGQLALVALLLAGARLIAAVPGRLPALAPRLAAETIGAFGVFLCLERATGALGL